MNMLELLLGALFGAALGALPALADKPAGALDRSRQQLKSALNADRATFDERRKEHKKRLCSLMFWCVLFLNTGVLVAGGLLSIWGLGPIPTGWLPEDVEPMGGLARGILGLLTLVLLVATIQQLYAPLVRGLSALRFRYDR